MPDAAEVAEATTDGMLGRLGRALLQVAEWYAGCSQHYPLEGYHASPWLEADWGRAPDLEN